MDVRDVLNAAIDDECAAYELYASTAGRAGNPAVRSLLLALADEERGHRELLESLDADRIQAFTPEARQDLKVADQLSEKAIREDSDLQDVMIYAMHKEQEAREFYARMSLALPDAELSGLFHKLSVMENTHKARLEELYEEVFLREN